MTFTRAIACVLAITLLLAAVAGGIGYTLGRLAPGYYRSVFHGGNDPRFDPVSVGVGQGLTQGTAGGVVAGLVVVALLCWRDVRLARATEGTPTTSPSVTGGGTSARVLLIIGGLLALIFCLGAGLLLGALGGEQARIIAATWKNEKYSRPYSPAIGRSRQSRSTSVPEAALTCGAKCSRRPRWTGCEQR